jgi:putative transcriptional regulator
MLEYPRRSVVGLIKVILSEALGERRMSRNDLVKMTGIRFPKISEYYNDLAERIDLDYLDRICDALDCDIDDILIRVDKEGNLITHMKKKGR